MAVFYTRQLQDSGVPLGGLGTGSIELQPDGEFHAWQIANPEQWSRDCRKRPDADDGERLAGSLSFYVRVQTASGDILLRRLDLGLGSGYGKEEYNYRMYSFMKPVEEVRYQGTFPTVSLDYMDRALPVRAALEAAAPFVPYEERTAGTPGCYLTFTLYNPTGEPLDVSLAGKLQSIADPGQDGRGRRSRLIKENGCTTLLSFSAGDGPEVPGKGGISLSVEDASATWLCGEYRGYMNEYVAHGELGVSEESFLFGFRRSGCLPGLTVPERPDWGDALVRLDELADTEVSALLDSLAHCGFGSSILERLRLAQPAHFETQADRREVLRYILKTGASWTGTPSGGTARCAARFAWSPERAGRSVSSWHGTFPACTAQGAAGWGTCMKTGFPALRR